MCAPDNKNEMSQKLEILKMYLPLHGLHAGKGFYSVQLVF